jgi:predicted CopG family antitoxin
MKEPHLQQVLNRKQQTPKKLSFLDFFNTAELMFKWMFKHTYPVVPMVKTITIRDEVYGKLLTVKGKNESFSELFDRLVECRAPIETLKQLRGKVEFTQKEQMLSELHAKRAEERD